MSTPNGQGYCEHGHIVVTHRDGVTIAHTCSDCVARDES